jgi:hypothetical protein
MVGNLQFLPLRLQAVWKCWFCERNQTKTVSHVLLEDTTAGPAAIGVCCPSHPIDDARSLLVAKRMPAV